MHSLRHRRALFLPLASCLKRFDASCTCGINGPSLVSTARLLQTHSELAETRAELEQLADDILAIKMLMDEESSLGANGAGRLEAVGCCC